MKTMQVKVEADQAGEIELALQRMVSSININAEASLHDRLLALQDEMDVLRERLTMDPNEYLFRFPTAIG